MLNKFKINKLFKIDVPAGTCGFVHIYSKTPNRKHHFSCSACVNKTSLCLELRLKKKN